jgi:hypothetical protein
MREVRWHRIDSILWHGFAIQMASAALRIPANVRLPGGQLRGALDAIRVWSLRLRSKLVFSDRRKLALDDS